jgi:CBS domain-containing protein
MFDILLIVFLIGMGLGLAWLTYKISGKEANAALLGIILMPGLLYLLMGGWLTEFSGFGITAKFKAELSKGIGATNVPLLSGASTADEAKVGNTEVDLTRNPELGAALQVCSPYFYLRSNGDEFDKRPVDHKMDRIVVSIARAIRASITCGKLRGLVILGMNDSPVGLFPAEKFLDLLAIRLIEYYVDGGNEALVNETTLAKQVRASELGTVLRYPLQAAQRQEDAVRLTIGQNDTLLDAMTKMLEHDTRVASLVDRSGKFVGLVTRDRVGECLTLLSVRAMLGAKAAIDEKNASVLKKTCGIESS